MGVVALAAIPQHVGRVLVVFDERGPAVTGEAAALEAKPSPSAQCVTFDAVGGERRMLAEQIETLGSPLSHEEPDLLASTLPDQGQRVLTGSGSQLGMENVGKGFLGGKDLAVQFQAGPRGRWPRC